MMDPLERVEAVMNDLWKRADINDPQTYDYAYWANDLGIALEELRVGTPNEEVISPRLTQAAPRSRRVGKRAAR